MTDPNRTRKLEYGLNDSSPVERLAITVASEDVDAADEASPGVRCKPDDGNGKVESISGADPIALGERKPIRYVDTSNGDYIDYDYDPRVQRFYCV